MLMLPATVRIYLCTAPADLRKSFDGLSGLVRDSLGHDPLSGHMYAFRNKRGDRLKILFWDRSGYTLWYKRLEAGTFRFPRVDARSHRIDAAELTLLLEGIELTGARRRHRFRLEPRGGMPAPA